MTTEDLYRTARDLRDQLTMAVARGEPLGDLEQRVVEARGEAYTAFTENAPDGERACAAIYGYFFANDEPQDADGDPFAHLSGEIEAAYAERQGAIDVGGAVLTRLQVLERLGVEPDRQSRHALFTALTPVWQSMAVRYGELLELSIARWRDGRSPLDRNADALGLDDVEGQLVTILESWRDAHVTGHAVEPWDWWHAGGAAARRLNSHIGLERMVDVSHEYLASLGADPRALGVGFDIRPRPGRPAVPVAYTEFGARPAPGRRAKPWVMATYSSGGLGELTELIHETGHAIHVAAIDTRPAFADWPDSDAFTEALAELPALDTAEPAWQRRWLGVAASERDSIKGRYADVMLDVCWALFEIRMHQHATTPPNAVWTDLTSTYLGIAPHPEHSWWAMRGQLVQEPGYMVNYALAAILAADLRAAIMRERGNWCGGDPGWYEWVSERIYRWGLERPSGEVLRGVLGRAPNADALTAEIRRGT